MMAPFWTREKVEGVLVQTLWRQAQTARLDDVGCKVKWPEYFDRNDYADNKPGRGGQVSSVDLMEHVLEKESSWVKYLKQDLGVVRGAARWSLMVCVGLSRQGQVRAWMYDGRHPSEKINWSVVGRIMSRETTHRLPGVPRTCQRHYMDGLDIIASRLPKDQIGKVA